MRQQQQQQQKQNMGKEQAFKTSSAKETMDIMMEMSKILNTGLDMETLATCVRLLESGVNPEALALVFNELKKESAAIQKRLSYFYGQLILEKQAEIGGCGNTENQASS